MTKRLFDISTSLAGLLLLSPLLILLAAIIKMDSRGPILFRQIRVGRHGGQFRIHKFRTMRTDTESLGLQITAGPDARITRAGRALRVYKLDELPQLLDVLYGDMSVVGPRPEVPRYMALYPDDARERILSVRPGITDWASILFKDENDILGKSSDPERTYVEQIMPLKQRFYLDYVTRQSFGEDLRIIAATVAAVFGRR